MFVQLCPQLKKFIKNPSATFRLMELADLQRGQHNQVPMMKAKTPEKPKRLCSSIHAQRQD